MRSATEELLTALAATRWFHAVGQPHARGDLTLVTSWAEALRDDDNDTWGEVRLLAANELRRAVGAADEKRYSQWSSIAAALRPLVLELAKTKTAEAIGELSFCGIVTDLASWDILHGALAAEFSDLVAGGFYRELAACYLQGRFPCDWRGEYPAGHLVVY